jgi:integrase/recombinase XerC
MSNTIRKNETFPTNKEQGAKETIKTKKKRTIKSIQPEYIVTFGEHLLQRNYSISTIKPHLTRAKQFHNYYSKSNNIDIKSLEDFKALKRTDIVEYEDFLTYRVMKKEIKAETAYSCIKNIRLFLQFLLKEKIIDFTYSIPKKFIVSPTRLNIYIPKELLLELIICAESDNSNPKYRSLAILSILIATGCRPVEVSNLKLSDLNLTEKKITLYSVKSGKYTLLLNDFVIKALKRYIKNRNLIETKSNHLFINIDGEPIPASYISIIIYGLNKKAFGTALVNARSIRHTYITNAIENNNEFKEISASVGHKHWESTLYYLHRSKKRLLLNTLDFNPIMNILEEDKYAD